MSLRSLGQTVGKYAPLLGKLLPIPGAGIAGDLISAAFGVDNTPSAIEQAIKTDPKAAVKLAQIEADHSVALQAQLLSAETARLETVNKTMRAEGTSEHWMQWSWRPFIGFIFGITFVGSYFVLPLLKISIPTIPTEAWFMIGAVLGVASYKRGDAKVEKARRGL